MPRWPWPPSSSSEYLPSAERNGAPRHSRRHSRPAEAPRIAAACPADPAEAGAHCAPATLPDRPRTARVADKVGNDARTSPRSRQTAGTWLPYPETTADPAQSPGCSYLSPAPAAPVQSSPHSLLQNPFFRESKRNRMEHEYESEREPRSILQVPPQSASPEHPRCCNRR